MPTQQALLPDADRTDDAAPVPGSRSDTAPGGAPAEGGRFAGGGLAALRLVPVPDSSPPFDGELTAGTPAAAVAWPLGMGWGNFGRGVPAEFAGWPRGDAPADVQASAQPYGGARAGARAGAGGPDADADGDGGPGDDWSRQFVLLLTEALAGARPVRQILPWTTDRARAHVDRLMPLFSGGQRPRVQRVMTSRPTRDVIEMTVVVAIGARTRALAVRLEREFQPRQGAPGHRATQARRTSPRWLCTAIEAA